ncbi:hypothetical protein PTI98_008758 [Pleurotus ostreatus]|nr:hypothetical protein PTI98_008758 [Pleurotus ostreatus]
MKSLILTTGNIPSVTRVNVPIPAKRNVRSMASITVDVGNTVSTVLLPIPTTECLTQTKLPDLLSALTMSDILTQKVLY